MKTTKFILVVIGLFFSIQFSEGQDIKSEKEKLKKCAAMVGFSLGYQNSDTEELNQKLASFSYGKFSPNFMTFGWHVNLLFKNRISLGGALSGLVNMDSPSSSGSTSNAYLSGRSSLFSIGSHHWIRENLDFITELSGGVNTMTLKLQNNQQFSDFDTALLTPSSSTLTSVNGIGQVAVGLDFYPKRKDAEGSNSKCKIGLKVGYQFGGKNSWEANYANVAGPSLMMDGFFLKLSMGILKRKLA